MKLPCAPVSVLRTAASLLLLLAVACASSSETAEEVPPPRLAGEWVLVALPGAAGVDVSAADSAPRLAVAGDGAVSGHAGVNRFSGRFDAAALAEGRLEASPLVTTRMAGPPAAMDLEQAFLEALAAAEEYRFDGDELVLTAGGEPVARLTR